jgi:hypothetical protein
METERVPCRTEGCGNTILPVTAKTNDGYCMPCVQNRRREERDEYIRQNRREVDPYAGITDAVEMLRVMHMGLTRFDGHLGGAVRMGVLV